MRLEGADWFELELVSGDHCCFYERRLFAWFKWLVETLLYICPKLQTLGQDWMWSRCYWLHNLIKAVSKTITVLLHLLCELLRLLHFLTLVHQHLKLAIAKFLPKSICRGWVDLGHHLRIEQFLIILTGLMVLVEWESTMQVLRISASVWVLLVDFVMNEPFPPLSTFWSTYQACITNLPLFAFPVVKGLIG